MRSIVTILVASFAAAYPNPAQTTGISFTQLLEAGVSNAVAIDGDVLYGGLGTYLLTIDVSDPSHPRRVHSKSLGANIRDIALTGNLALVATAAGLRIMDISNPPNPVILANAPTGNTTGVDVEGAIACVAWGAAGVRTVDISSPAQPIVLGNVALNGWPTAIRTVGSLAYVLGWGVFSIVDISNPNAPIQLGSLSGVGLGYAFDVVGSLAYVPGNDMAIVDVSVPTSPSLIAEYDSDFSDVTCVAVSGNHAFVMDRYDNFDVVDVSNSAAPTRIAHLIVDGGNDIALQGSQLYTADEQSSFRVIDVSNPANPGFSGSCKLLLAPHAVSTAGDAMYIGESTRLTTWDVHDPTEAVFSGEVSFDCERITSVFPRGDILFAGRTDCWSPSENSGLSILDVSNPAQPVYVGTSYSFDNIYEVIVDDQYAYVLGYRSGSEFAIYNIANPATPLEVSSVATEFIAWHFDLHGSLVLLANETHGLKVYDVSNPNSPTLRSVFNGAAKVEDVVAIGDVAFIADPTAGLVAVDFSDPDNPLEIGRMSGIGQPTHVAARNPYVILVGTDPMLRIVDVSNPASPMVVADYETGGSQVIAIQSPYIATLVGSESSLLILEASVLNDVSAARPPRQAQPSLFAYPNPFNPSTTISFSVPRSEVVSLQLFDVRGAFVRTLASGWYEAGGHSVSWDGSDGDGNHAASGVYLCRLRAGSETVNHKLVLLK